MDIPERPRRLRRTPALRRLVQETAVRPADLVLPVFVREGADTPIPIGSMPGVVQHSESSLKEAATDAAEQGIGGIMLFGVPTDRDACGDAALDPALARLWQIDRPAFLANWSAAMLRGMTPLMLHKLQLLVSHELPCR